MLTVGRMARRFGLARSTLLYYDRIGLLSPTGRSRSNYRLYPRTTTCERLSPEGHEEFLRSLGIAEEEVARIRRSAAQAQSRVRFR